MENEELIAALKGFVAAANEQSAINREGQEKDASITSALSGLKAGQVDQAATCLICRTATDRGFEALAVAMKEIMDTRANYARWEKIILTALAALITVLSYWVGNTKGVNELKSVLPEIIQEIPGSNK